MLVTREGLNSGTVGGGLIEAKALDYALDFLTETKLNQQTKFILGSLLYTCLTLLFFYP